MEQTKHGTPQTFVQVLSIALTVAAHAHFETFLQAAVLASVAVMLSHFARFGVTTSVAELLPDASFEEAFATLATYCSIVPTCGEKNRNDNSAKSRNKSMKQRNGMKIFKFLDYL